MGFKTLVIGASTNPERFSYLAIKSLVKHNIEVVAIGLKEGVVEGVKFHVGKPNLSDIHTISLYINANNQKDYIDYFFSLNPKRIIINPGTENGELIKRAREKNVELVFGCTLVMLSNGTYFEPSKVK